MTGFSLDFNDTFAGSRIENGTYEVLITHAAENATPSGAEFVDFRLTIRNDIKQASQNMIIFEKVWKAKATGKYNMMMFNTIGKAAQLEKGKTYASFNDLLEDFLNKPLKVTVKNETSEYNGKTYENLNVVMGGWQQTAFPQVQHTRKNESNNTNAPIDNTVLKEDDLPF